MNLSIKPLTPELVADYFDFFENRAFTDDSPYRCYCQVYQMSKEQYQTVYEKITAEGLDPGCASREVAEQQIENGVLRGYLAYADGKSIGWCNANDRANYPSEPVYDDTPFHAPAEMREKAVVCFEIAPEYRGKGVATMLLQQVINDAKTEGYIAVVGFPTRRDERYEWDCSGPVRLYDKAGFSEVARNGDRIVMRKDLNSTDETDEERQARIYPIILNEYNPAWPEWFAEEKVNLERLIGENNIAGIHHYGSTSVPGLTAKPIVDIMLELAETVDIEKIIALMPEGEYITLRREGNSLSEHDRIMIIKGYTDTGFADKVFHIHVRNPGDWDELYFRDYLIAHPKTAAEYTELKRSLFKEYEHNRDGYTAAKGAFIKKITEKARELL